MATVARATAVAVARPGPSRSPSRGPVRRSTPARCRATGDLRAFVAHDFVSGSLKQVAELSLRRVEEPLPGLAEGPEDPKAVPEATVRIYNGELEDGREVCLKQYPRLFSELARNEIFGHSAVQAAGKCAHVCELLGTYKGTLGETWLVFSSECIYPASYWAERARAIGEQRQARNWTLLNLVDPQLDLNRRTAFLNSMVGQALKGLAELHAQNILHQNVTPDCFLLSTTDERGGGQTLKAKLRELSLCVSVTEASLRGGGTLAELWEAGAEGRGGPAGARREHEEDLWRRAERGGCSTFVQKRNFGIAEDVQQMGLSILFLVLRSFAGQESELDFDTVRRYACVTFKGEVSTELRDFVLADTEYADAVAYLDGLGSGPGADGDTAVDLDGWGLLEAMVDPDWRRRPTAEACLTLFR